MTCSFNELLCQHSKVNVDDMKEPFKHKVNSISRNDVYNFFHIFNEHLTNYTSFTSFYTNYLNTDEESIAKDGELIDTFFVEIKEQYDQGDKQIIKLLTTFLTKRF